MDVRQFIDTHFLPEELPEIIGVHILMGGGCSPEIWKQVVRKAVYLKKTLFIFEHRKACRDWPEWDVDPSNILPEKAIDKYLLGLSSRWEKYGAANRRGNIRDVRNIAWILDWKRNDAQ